MNSVFGRYETASVFVRNRLGVSRLTSEQAAAVRVAVEKHQQRAERRLATAVDPRTSVERLQERLRAELRVEVTPIMKALFRVSKSTWAGGDTTVEVSRSHAPSASGKSFTVWSDNRKWSGSSVVLSVSVMPGWLRHVKPVDGLATAGGMLTTHAEPVSNDCWRASWVRQGRGFELVSESGYIVRLGSEFFHGKTEKSARSVAARKLAAEKMSARRGALAAELRDLSASQLVERYGELKIRRSDSLRSGNCQEGTDHWIELNFPGCNEATISDVLAVDSADRVVDAVRAAILRQVKSQKKLMAS